jgi:aspartate aminotransferase-like enzyme
LTLSCPGNALIDHVVFASYGTPTGTCGHFVQGTCHASTSEAVVASACVGKQSCTVFVNNGEFGDPCQGIVKQLDVEVACAGDAQVPCPPLSRIRYGSGHRSKHP